MVKFELLAASALAMGALAHPTIKHIGSEKRFCANEAPDAIFARDLTSRATISKAKAWSPPSAIVTALDQVWKQTLKENPDGLKDKNWIVDQLIANNGNLNYCVRWNTKAHKSTAASRTKITALLQRSMQKWFDVLVGFEGFPLTKMTVKTVGYAVKDKSLIEGSTSGLNIYTSTSDPDGVPECDPRCFRGAHLNDPKGISSCPGGAASRYDISLWLDESLEGQMGGFGYNWGQELGPDYVLNNLDADNLHILLHEMGHGFGLLDFYDWVPSGQTNFIMMAGSATEITEFDAWMLRDWYRKLKAARGW